MTSNNRPAQSFNICALHSELAANKAETAARASTLEGTSANLAHENALLKRKLHGIRTERVKTSELQLALGDLLAGEAQLQKELHDAVGQAEDSVGPEPKPGAGPRATPKGRHNLNLSKPPRVVIEIAGRAPRPGGATATGACTACPMRARGFVEHLAPSRDDRDVPAVEPPWPDGRAIAPTEQTSARTSPAARRWRCYGFLSETRAMDGIRHIYEACSPQLASACPGSRITYLDRGPGAAPT